jgi:predicted CoA-binding protein
MIEPIEDFLARRRIAIVGVSHEAKEFSRMVFRAFRDRDYDVVPVNPNVRVIEGKYCFPRVQEVQPPVEAALVMTPAAVTSMVRIAWQQGCGQLAVRCCPKRRRGAPPRGSPSLWASAR